MLKRFTVALSLAAALGLGIAIATPSLSLAKKPHEKKVIVVKKGFNKKVYIVGKTYNGNIWYGYKRHRWRGVWYAYGVGPCWINVDGLWFWNVVACP